MFLLGGSIADRLGYKPAILAGCTLRTVGFAALGFAGSLPVLLLASAATGFAGALFNPAVRAYLAAGLFLALTVLQARALPARRAPVPGQRAGVTGVPGDWRTVMTNCGFVVFTVAMAGSYVLNFQVYLALPRGLTIMAVAFLPILAMPPLADTLEDVADAPSLTAALVMAPALLTASLLGLGSALVYPFEMDTVVRLSGDRLVATHYGLYNTVSGIAITLGNLAIGAAPGLDAPIAAIVPWLALAALGAVGAVSLTMIGKSGGITNTSPPTGSPAAQTR